MSRHLRVLIVDDENVFKISMKSIINWEEEGFLLVGFASNGEEALEMVELTFPDIIITDMVMPKINGNQLIQELNKKYTHISVIILSGYNDFHYVKEALKLGASDYILKPELNKEILLQTLQSVSSSLQNITMNDFHLNKFTFLSNLIHNFYTSDILIGELLEKYKIDIDLTNTLVLYHSFQTKQLYDNNILYNYFNQQFVSVPKAIFFIDQNNCHLIVNESSVSTVNQILMNSKKEFPHLIWGMSKTFDSIVGFTNAIRECELATKDYFYDNFETIFIFKDTTRFQSELYIEQSKIEYMINALNFTSIELFVLDYLELCSHRKDQDPYHVKKNCEHTIYNIINQLESLNYDVNTMEENKLTYFKEIEEITTINDLKNTFMSIIGIIRDTLSIPNSYYHNIVTIIDSFIEENYDKKIMLSDIADEVHLNYFYMSKVLNTYYKENFSEHLNKYRIKKAKELLISTSYSVSEISTMVGFTGQSYFGKIFKNLVGMSPSEYRNKSAL